MQKDFLLLVLAAAATVVCGVAQAHGITVKAGVIRYDANSKTNGVTGIGIPPGADAEVGDATTAVFTVEFEVKPNVGIELVMGVPAKIKATASGSVAFLGEVLTARNVAPTVLVNYHFGKSGDTLRPYLGVGVNYTKFTNVTSPYGWDVKLSDSVGMAVQAGVDYQLSKNWGLFASVARVDVQSKLTAVGATVLQSKIDFRPITYAAGLSYRFCAWGQQKGRCKGRAKDRAKDRARARCSNAHFSVWRSFDEHFSVRHFGARLQTNAGQPEHPAQQSPGPCRGAQHRARGAAAGAAVPGHVSAVAAGADCL